MARVPPLVLGPRPWPPSAPRASSFDGPVGERAFHPTAAGELRDSYRMAIGNLDVDLRDMALPAGTTDVKVVLGIGEARVHVPEGVALRVTGHAGAGEVGCPGRRRRRHRRGPRA